MSEKQIWSRSVMTGIERQYNSLFINWEEKDDHLGLPLLLQLVGKLATTHRPSIYDNPELQAQVDDENVTQMIVNLESIAAVSIEWLHKIKYRSDRAFGDNSDSSEQEVDSE
jgi:hypothetical protein